jgi:hypothetical protein
MDFRAAAFYVGLSPNTFKERVKNGRYPAPTYDGKRVLWDRLALDRAIDLDSGITAGANYNEEATAEAAAMEAIRRRK